MTKLPVHKKISAINNICTQYWHIGVCVCVFHFKTWHQFLLKSTQPNKLKDILFLKEADMGLHIVARPYRAYINNLYIIVKFVWGCMYVWKRVFVCRFICLKTYLFSVTFQIKHKVHQICSFVRP